MKNGIKHLSDQQWRFLAILETLGAPVPINLACGLEPISPSELIDLTDYAMSAGWLQKQEPDSFLLAPKLPEWVRKRIQRLATAPFISSLLERMKEPELSLTMGSPSATFVAKHWPAGASITRSSGQTRAGGVVSTT